MARKDSGPAYKKPLSQIGSEYENVPDVEEQGRDFSTTEEVFQASYDYADMHTLGGISKRREEEEQAKAKSSLLIDPETLNKKYPGMPTPFREPTNPLVAEIRFNNYKRIRELQERMSNADPSMANYAAQMAAGLVAQFTDPKTLVVNAGLSIATAGIGAVGGLGSGVKNTLRAMSLGKEVALGSRLGAMALVEAIPNVASEVYQAQQEGSINDQQQLVDPRSGGERLVEMGISAAVGTALGVGIGELGYRGVRKARELGARALEPRTVLNRLADSSPEAIKVVESQVAQAAEGNIRPDVTPVIHAAAKETDVRTGPVGQAYEYIPLREKTPESTRFYTVVRNFGDSPNAGSSVSVADRFGINMPQATDNPYVAVAAATREGVAAGTVVEVKLNKLNPLSINEKIPDNVADQLVAYLDSIGIPDAKKRVETGTLKDILELEEIHADISDADKSGIVDIVKEQGYNALLDDSRTRMGTPSEPHNAVSILDDSILESLGKYSPEPTDVTKKFPSQEVKQVTSAFNDPMKKTYVDEDIYFDTETKLKDAGQVPTEQLATATDANKAKTELVTEIDEAINDAHSIGLDANEIQALEKLKENIQNQEIEDMVAKAAMKCVELT